jgi:hypothetical protein
MIMERETEADLVDVQEGEAEDEPEVVLKRQLR